MYGKRERRLVLEHELAHHRSGDLVANLFAFVLLCLQWFNPLAWMAHAAFRFDQEAACDARVLDKAAAADRASYGRAIARPLRGGRCSSRARSIVQQACKGGSSPCFVVPAQPGALPAVC